MTSSVFSLGLQLGWVELGVHNFGGENTVPYLHVFSEGNQYCPHILYNHLNGSGGGHCFSVCLKNSDPWWQPCAGAAACEDMGPTAVHL